MRPVYNGNDLGFKLSSYSFLAHYLFVIASFLMNVINL